MSYIVYLLPFFFFLQTRIAIINTYAVSDYNIGFIYLRDFVGLLFLVVLIKQSWGSVKEALVRNRHVVVWVLSSIVYLLFVLYIRSAEIITYYKLVHYCLIAAYAYAIGVFIARAKDNAKLFWGIPIVIVAVVCISVGEMVLGHSLGLWVLGEWDFSLLSHNIATVTLFGVRILRPYAFFPHPNVLGAIAGLGLFVYGYRLVVLSSFRNIDGVALGGLLLVFILAFSRNAWIAFLVSTMYVYGFNGEIWNKYLRKRRYVLFLVLLAFMLGMYGSELFQFSHPAVRERILFYKQAFQMLQSHLWFGIGFGRYISLLMVEIPRTYPFLVQPVHNIFVLVLVEIGILGTILVGGFFRTLMSRLSLGTKEIDQRFVIGLWCYIGLTALFDHYWYTLPVGIAVCWIVVGYTNGFLRLENDAV